MIYGLLALVIAALFAGAAGYITLAEHPARMLLPTGPLLTQWKPSYARGFTMQATLAVLGGVAGVAAWWVTREMWFLVAALVLIANWPYTLLVIMPVNHRLNATDPSIANDDTRRDLIRWGQLHAVRTGLGLFATGILIWALATTSESAGGTISVPQGREAATNLADWTAIGVACIALGLTVYEAGQSRQHNRLSVAPRFGGDSAVVPTAERATITLTNAGLGPAVIRGFRWKLDGKSKDELNVKNFSDLTRLLNLGPGVVYEFPLTGDVIAAATVVTAVSVPVGTYNSTRAAEIRAAFGRLWFEIDYASLYGESPMTYVWVGSRSHPQELSELDDELRG